MIFQRSFETKFIPDICILLQPLVLILVTLYYLHYFVLQISCFATMENILLSFSKLIQFLVWAEENKVDAFLVVIMYHNVKKIDGKQCLRLILILFDQVPFICIFARWMVILQDSCKTKGYLARSCKICEENLARRCIVSQDFARILQDLAR